jgi:hypothetical protein
MSEAPEDWELKAAFMRAHRATAATWAPDGELISLHIPAPAAAAPPAATPAPAQPRPPGPAARMADFHARNEDRLAKRHHDVLFASSSMRPKFDPAPAPASVVPRAVREREAAAQRGSTKKRTKR